MTTRARHLALRRRRRWPGIQRGAAIGCNGSRIEFIQRTICTLFRATWAGGRGAFHLAGPARRSPDPSAPIAAMKDSPRDHSHVQLARMPPEGL